MFISSFGGQLLLTHIFAAHLCAFLSLKPSSVLPLCNWNPTCGTFSNGNIVDKYWYVSIFLDIESIDTKTKMSRKKGNEKSKSKKLCKFVYRILIKYDDILQRDTLDKNDN